MRLSRAAAAFAAIVVIAACAGGEATGPAGSCIGMFARAQGATYYPHADYAGAPKPSEAGALFAVVQRERKCEMPPVTVTDSAYPVYKHDGPVVDGDAMLLRVGTRLYMRVGSEPGQELVAEYAPGEWVRLVREPAP